MADNLRIDLSADMRQRAGLPPADDDAEQQPAAGADGSLSPADRQRIIAAERQRVLAIVDACRLAGRQDLAGGFIESGTDLGDVVQALGTPRGAGRRLGRA